MGVYENVRNGVYTNTMEYPVQPKRPKIKDGATAAEAREYANLLEEFEIAESEYAELRSAYYNEAGRIETKFQLDLEEEYAVVGHVMADKLYGKAYERGHSGGYAEIASAYADMVELIGPKRGTPVGYITFSDYNVLSSASSKTVDVTVYLKDSYQGEDQSWPKSLMAVEVR